MIKNVWIIDSGIFVLKRCYTEEKISFLDEFILALFSELSTEKKLTNMCITNSVHLYYVSEKEITIIMSIDKENLNNVYQNQILETLNYIYIKYLEKNPGKKHNTAPNDFDSPNLYESFAEEIDTILGLSAIITNEKTLSYRIFTKKRNKTSAVVKKLMKRYGQLNTSMNLILQNHLDHIDPILDNFPNISDRNRKDLQHIASQLRQFIDLDIWLSRL